MLTIPHWLSKSGPLVFLGALFLAAGAAVGQEKQTASQSKPQPEVKEETTKVSVITKEEPKPYDLWTTKYLTGDWGGVRTDLKDAGINFSILLGTMSQINFRGGLNTHNAHETGGKAFYNLELDFEKMGLIRGATFFGRCIQTWNSGIGADVGSLTPPYYSTGSSGDRAFELDKWWYRQRLFDNRLEFRLGKINNVDVFDRNAYADNYMKKFMNKAFYRNQTFPATKGLGAFVRVWPADWLYASALVIDPDYKQTTCSHGWGGFDTAFGGEDRFRAFLEFGVLPSKMHGGEALLPGHYRFGLWLDPKSKKIFIDDLGGLRADQHRNGDVGFYFNFDQMMWKENDNPKDNQGLGIFARYGSAHRDVNKISHFWSVGAEYQGLVPSRDADVLALGVAQSILSSRYRHNVNSLADRETVYELYYSIKLTPWCIMTPDLQIITNPGGNKDARDAIVGGIRFKIAI